MGGKIKNRACVRVPLGWYYWAVSPDISDIPAWYRVKDRRDGFDQRAWDEGRYFLCEEDAKAYVREETERQRREIRLKRRFGKKAFKG